MFLVYRMVEDPPFLKRLSGAGIRVDYIGIALLALGVGALQVVLDKGQEDDWFGSHFILTLVRDCGGLPDFAGDLGVVPREPIIDVRLFKNFNFASAEPDDVHAGRRAISAAW